MSRAIQSANKDLLKYALTLPEAWEDHPWGGVVAKVRKKVFCFLSNAGEKDRVSLSVKLPESEASALDLPSAEPTPYGLGKHGWVTFGFEEDELPELNTLKGFIEESYRAVAPKTLIKLL